MTQPSLCESKTVDHADLVFATGNGKAMRIWKPIAAKIRNLPAQRALCLSREKVTPRQFQQQVTAALRPWFPPGTLHVKLLADRSGVVVWLKAQPEPTR